MLKINLLSLTRIFIFGTLLFYSSGCSSSSVLTKEEYFKGTVSQIDSLFNEEMFEHAHWGVLIKSLDTGKKWYEKNSHKMYMPASNQKIITTASAMVNLGPDFKFDTKVYYTGEIKDSVLMGDLIVWSNGDPTFYTRFFDDPRSVFYNWADILDSLGIQKITGDIIGNDNAFDDNHLGYGWSHNGLDSWYSAEVGALQLNENYIDFLIIPPDTSSDSLIIIPNLPSEYYNFVNNIEVTDTGRSRLRYERKSGENIIYFSGSVRAGRDTIEVSPSITNPTLFYVTVLREVFNEKGIIVEGRPLDIDEIDDYVIETNDDSLLIHHQSPELSEVLKFLMKDSQNLYAETMIKVLGWYSEGLGTFEAGEEIVDSTLLKMGVAENGYKFRDGSGLSRYNYVSPESLVKILEVMYESDYSEEWLASFPIGGVDGTLEKRFMTGSASENVRAKTGTISNVRGLSGYVTTREGENIVFSFLINGHMLRSRDTEIITDRVIEIIADYGYPY